MPAFGVSAALSHDDIGTVSEIKEDAQNPFDATGLFFGEGEDKHEDADQDQDSCVDDQFGCGVDWGENGCHAEDEEDVKDTGTDGVAQGDSGISFSCGGEGSHQFRQRGADGNDGQPDEGVTHAPGFCNQTGVVYDQIAAEDNGDKPENHGEDTFWQRQGDGSFFIGSILQGTAHDNEEISRHAEQ